MKEGKDRRKKGRGVRRREEGERERKICISNN